jgi:hypothetical protein
MEEGTPWNAGVPTISDQGWSTTRGCPSKQLGLVVVDYLQQTQLVRHGSTISHLWPSTASSCS